MNIFNNLTDEEKQKIKYLNLKTNEVLFHEGEECHNVYLVLQGRIEIVSYSLEGNEEIISTLKKDDVFANALIFSKKNIFLGEIIAKEKTTLAYLSKTDLLNIFQRNTTFLEAYINLISEKTIRMTQKSKILAHKSIRSRIICFLECNEGKYLKNITSLSKELVLPRPSVSREIHKMILEKLIFIKNGYIHLADFF